METIFLPKQTIVACWGSKLFRICLKKDQLMYNARDDIFEVNQCFICKNILPFTFGMAQILSDFCILFQISITVTFLRIDELPQLSRIPWFSSQGSSARLISSFNSHLLLDWTIVDTQFCILCVGLYLFTLRWSFGILGTLKDLTPGFRLSVILCP